MGKTIIGTKTVTQIGGVPQSPIGDDEVVGSSHYTYVSEEEAKKADSIVGLSSSLIFGDPDIKKVDNLISRMKDAIGSDSPDTRQLKQLIDLYERTNNNKEKIEKAHQILSVGANIAQIASFILQLGQLLKDLIPIPS